MLSSRAYSGRLDAGSYILNTRSKQRAFLVSTKCTLTNKIQSNLLRLEILELLFGFKDIKTGDTMCDENKILESMKFLSQ